MTRLDAMQFHLQGLTLLCLASLSISLMPLDAVPAESSVARVTLDALLAAFNSTDPEQIESFLQLCPTAKSSNQ